MNYFCDMNNCAMKDIENVLLCGVGAVGAIYADKISNFAPESLKVLVDKKRFEKYCASPKIFNGKKLNLNYILPDDKNFKADLIIIATKYDGLFEAIENIKNFVDENTIILSLLNGVTSEEIISQKYGWKHTLLSYFVGHSSMRCANSITHDGVGYTCFGTKDEKTDKNDVQILKNYFDKVGIQYKTPENMYRSLWLKFMLNVSSNQPSAILNMTFGQMQQNEKFVKFMRNIMQEVVLVAKACGVQETQTMADEAMITFKGMIPSGKTSMLQDIEAKRVTEVEMFAGTIIKLGEKYNIPTPYNIVMKEMIEIIQQNYKN